MLIGAPKIHTDLLWDLTILFSGLGILFFAFVFIFRNRLSAKRSKVSRQKKILAPIISNFLFYETDASKEENYEYIKLKIEIRDLLKSPFSRLVLTEILLDLQKSRDMKIILKKLSGKMVITSGLSALFLCIQNECTNASNSIEGLTSKYVFSFSI